MMKEKVKQFNELDLKLDSRKMSGADVVGLITKKYQAIMDACPSDSVDISELIDWDMVSHNWSKQFYHDSYFRDLAKDMVEGRWSYEQLESHLRELDEKQSKWGNYSFEHNKRVSVGMNMQQRRQMVNRDIKKQAMMIRPTSANVFDRSKKKPPNQKFGKQKFTTNRTFNNRNSVGPKKTFVQKKTLKCKNCWSNRHEVAISQDTRSVQDTILV